MAIVHEFEYVKPETLDEAVAVLAKCGEGARVLAGGTDLVGWLRDELVAPDVIVDIKGVRGLGEIVLENGALTIGALVTFADLIDSSVVHGELPLVGEMARTVASTGIRNRATLVGNICSAVPSCDAGPVLLVCEAVVHVRGVGCERTIPIREWFTGPKQTALGAGEMVTAVTLAVPDGGHGACYVKLGRLRGEDLAQASVAVLALPGREFRVAFGAVAPTPVRAPAIEALLSGRGLDDALIEEAKKLVPEETSPIADLRASRAYRVHMLPIMLERGLRAAVARRGAGGPAYGTRLV